MAFRHHQNVMYRGCNFEFIQMIDQNRALIRNKSRLKKEDLVVDILKLSPSKKETR